MRVLLAHQPLTVMASIGTLSTLCPLGCGAMLALNVNVTSAARRPGSEITLAVGMTEATERHLMDCTSDPDTIHVYPLDDIVEHETTGDDCACGPTTEPVSREDGTLGWLVTHHSLDGREARE